MKRNKGFTLIELVVVMAIIAVLALLIVAAIMAARRQSQTTQRVGNIKTIETALESRASACGGEYFVATDRCTVVIPTNSILAIHDALENEDFLSQPLGGTFGDGYTLEDAVAGANTFDMRACTFPDTACDDAGGNIPAYSALR